MRKLFKKNYVLAIGCLPEARGYVHRVADEEGGAQEWGGGNSVVGVGQ